MECVGLHVWVVDLNMPTLTILLCAVYCCWCVLPHPGKGLDLVRLFYSLLPQRHRWVEAQAQAAVFIIDETFAVPGVGTVVAGGLSWLAGWSLQRQ